ncbi:hypothetical protein SCHPADRAFT_934525 [Schizopora paradoxa]|uniref:F-box domain-containing protein n=1 Tax=Schizopora paradoxa TaxID=27342 RepID=A0A0H2SUA0_9AGAM|nr:hypothetical protein SCHPADRAFT_934525 [Schizopora paradoxa]
MSAIDAAETSGTPSSNGKIESIPDDILALFAGYGFAESGVASTIAFSHVCRSFRGAVMDQALLWTELSSTFHIDQVRACIERSGNAGLNVQLVAREVENYKPEEIHAFLLAVLPSSTRWETFSIQSPPRIMWEDKYAIVQLLRDARGLCSGLDLPRLKSLQLEYNLKGLIDVPGATTFTSWSFSPSLREIYAINFIIPPSSITSNITSLNLHYSEKRLSLARDLLAFLSSTQSLQKLSMRFHSLDIDLHRGALPQISLRHLDHFLLRLSANPLHADLSLLAVQVFVRAISMPNLKSHSISLEFPGNCVDRLEHFGQQVSNLIPNPATHLQLKSFNFAVFITSGSHGRDCSFPLQFTFPLRKIPQVERLAFASNIQFEFSSQEVSSVGRSVIPSLPHLKHLTLTCPRMSGGGLFDLVERLEDVGMWEGLEEMQFVGCNALKSREIFKIIDTREKRVEIAV